MVLPRGFKLVKDTAEFSWFRFDRLETEIHVIFHQFDLDSVGSLSDNDLVDLQDYVGEVFVPGPSALNVHENRKKLPGFIKPYVSKQFGCH